MYDHFVRRVLAAFVILSFTGCLSFDEVHCADGTVCPVGSKCLNNQCVSPEQIAACQGLDDGNRCELLGGSGTCSAGICEPWLCGDGNLNGIEQCDGDDFGQGGPVDCRDPRAGYYEPGLVKCSANCRWDFSDCRGICADGIVNGPELCDTVISADESCLDYGLDAGRLGCSQCGPAFGGCHLFGWRRIVTGQFEHMNAIGGAATTFFVAGNAGTILRWNGGTFDVIDSKMTKNLFGVWGTSANDMFFVGDTGTILHFDGTKIDVMNSSTTSDLRAVWGTGSTNVYAVGAGGTIVHYDGAWAPMTSNTTTNLNGVWGTANTVVAVGTGSTLTNGNVVQYNGTSWVVTATLTRADTTKADLRSVWGTGASDVFAATPYNEVFHFNGSAWSRNSALASAAPSALAGVIGGTGNDVFAVGPAVLHFDGTAWSKLIAPAAAAAARAVWRSPTGEVWIAGLSGFVAHWGGAGWTTAVSNTTNVLRAVATATPSDAWAVGAGSGGPATILHYDGASWMPQASGTANNAVLTAVWAASASFVVAVGSNVIRHFDGANWTPPMGVTGILFGVWGFAMNDLIAVGNTGTVLRGDGSTWAAATQAAPNTVTFGAVWGTSATSVIAVGQTTTLPLDGVIYRFDGSWTSMAAPPTRTLQGVWGSSATDVFAAGDAVLHYEGVPSNPWSQMTSTGKLLHAITGTGPRNVFAVGDNATLLHYDGISWTPMRVLKPDGLPATDNLRGVAATSRSVIVVGDNGFLQRLSFSLRPTESDCRDGWDDDGDSNPDCADSDCAMDPYCVGGGTCAVTQRIKCGDSITASTVGHVSGRDYYRCTTHAETGGERTYRFDPDVSGAATATLTTAQGDLDVIVIGAMTTSPACDPDFACLRAGATAQATETVTFPATAGKSHYIVVEGNDRAAAPFTLTLSCP